MCSDLKCVKKAWIMFVLDILGIESLRSLPEEFQIKSIMENHYSR